MDGTITKVHIYADFQKLAGEANLDDKTLLATDYLNHFNEVVMLLQMVPDKPEIMVEAKAWRLLSYTKHFAHSSFSAREIAIAAYDHVLGRYKTPFEQTVGQLGSLIAYAIEKLDGAIAAREPQRLRILAAESAQNIQRLMDVASGIIDGIEKPWINQRTII